MNQFLDMSDERVFLLTGCASGIGRHLADVLASRGQRVFATDINDAALAEYARSRLWPEERTRIRRLDVRDADAWGETVRETVGAFGRLDVLLNVAGYLAPNWVREVAVEDVHRHFDINAKGTVFGTQAAARQMIEQGGGGHIVNIASMAGLAPIPGLSVYSASKYAVRAFSLAAAQELRPHGVYVTVVCPAGVQTPMLERQRDREEAALTFSSANFLTVEEIAHVVLKRVLVRKPLEVFIPARTGWLARFADLFPGTYPLIGPIFEKRGRAGQARLREESPMSRRKDKTIN